MNLSAYTAARQSAAWRPLSHFGRFHVAGHDAATLLHHLSTNNIKALHVGGCCEAALISAKARLLDWLSIYRVNDGFLVVTSPNRRDLFAPHAQRFILYRQQVAIDDITESTALFGLLGPNALKVLYDLSGSQLSLDSKHFIEAQIDGVAVTITRTHRLPDGGIWMWSRDGEGLRRIAAQTALPIVDDETYNVLRVEGGVPAAGLELTEEVNPWEARLDDSISLSKGCYNGQEVVARLNTYQKVSKRLCGLSLSAPLAMGTRAELKEQDGERVAGWLSSSVDSPRFGPIALGYVRGDWQESGTEVKAVWDGGQAVATVRALPFAEEN